ncbi:cation:proton antiporter [Streptomyces sp. NPDC006332]|uniref:cation:proton antiporter domain-containing protein n=1 Tax=Streptomyces sp. NPDC006332 TaxID=3155456 RepID=UPI0033BB68D5
MRPCWRATSWDSASGVAPPVVLLILGALIGVVPAVRQTQLPPEVVLLLFLPVLLYWESLTTSMREIRSNLRGIVLLSTVLVILTAGVVAVAGHALGLPWGPAWALGAAVAPTDATAVSALAGSLPRRQVMVLRAESLVNDGTALVIYGLAVGITVGEEHLTLPHVGALFLLAYGGGAAVGVAVAWVNMNLRRRLDDPLLGNGRSRRSSGTGAVASRQPLDGQVVGVLDHVGDQPLGDAGPRPQ